jgi:hypothetical protein
MEVVMDGTLEAIFQRRAVKVFEPVEISEELREQILNPARYAPSSFNTQPYRFYWVETAKEKTAVAKLCLGQKPAETASALLVAVADIGSLTATSQGQLEWMRSRSEFSEAKIRDYERTAKIGRILFMPGPFGTFGAVKWGMFLAAELVEGDGDAAPVSPGLVQMGDEEHIASLRESDDRCRSAGNQHMSHGRL